MELTPTDSDSPKPPPTHRWFCSRKEAIVLKEWNGEYVCFLEHRDTNHHLTTVAGAILEILLHAEKHLSADDLFTLIFGNDDKGDCILDRKSSVSSLESILCEFEKIGLAETDLS